MVDCITQRNIKKFGFFYIIVNAVFLIELLPTLGFSLPAVLSFEKNNSCSVFLFIFIALQKSCC